MLKRFMATFFAGLFALLPLMITIGVIGFLVTKLFVWLGPGSSFGQWLASIYPRLGSLIPLSFVLVILSDHGRRLFCAAGNRQAHGWFLRPG